MTVNLIYNELRLQVLEMRQYWFETVAGLLIMIATFCGLFYGVQAFTADAAESTSLDGLVFGFLMWAFASAAYGSIPKSVTDDTQKGYLEQLFLCPNGFVSVMLARLVAELLQSAVTIMLMAYVTMWLTDNWLSMNFFEFYGLMLLAAPSLIGIGFIMSGCALLFKRIEALHAIMIFALMGLVAIPGLPLSALSLLPFTPGASLARDVILNDGAMTMANTLVVVTNSAVYFVLGLVVYGLCERAARKRNLIGQY